MSDTLIPDLICNLNSYGQLTCSSPVISSQQALFAYGPSTQDMTVPSFTTDDAGPWWQAIEQTVLPTNDAGQGSSAIAALDRQPLNQGIVSHNAWNGNHRRRSINKRPCGYCQSSKVKV